jgi:hypothetical protein
VQDIGKVRNRDRLRRTANRKIRIGKRRHGGERRIHLFFCCLQKKG